MLNKTTSRHGGGRSSLWRADRPAEAGAVQEGVGAAGPADQAGDAQQPELRLQAAHRGAEGVAHCQGAARRHPANRGDETNTQHTRGAFPPNKTAAVLEPVLCKFRMREYVVMESYWQFSQITHA